MSDAIDRAIETEERLLAKLTAREKRMREVAEEMVAHRKRWLPGCTIIDEWAAKLLEELGESASKKEDA